MENSILYYITNVISDEQYHTITLDGWWKVQIEVKDIPALNSHNLSYIDITNGKMCILLTNEQSFVDIKWKTVSRGVVYEY